MIRRDEGLQIYRKLILARLCEEKLRELYPANEIKTPIHLGIGGEAIPVGVIHAMAPGTKYFGTYRNHTLFLALSNDTDGFFGELYGKMTGVGKGKAGSMHLTSPAHGLIATSAVVGTTIPVAVGSAYAAKYRKSNDVSVVFFGDGAMEEGTFWESMNFASLHRLRVLFVCEDNDLAIHSHFKTRRGFRSIMDAAKAFHCHIGSAPGHCVTKVVAATRKILKEMSSKPGPGLLHCPYFRFLEHVGPNEDFVAGYRKKPVAKKLQQLEPIFVFTAELKKLGVKASDINAIDAEIHAQVTKSVRAAQEAPFPPASELYTDVLA